MSVLLAAAGEVDTGDTAWMLVATALVLLMTPALGLFYAGLVRAKNTRCGIVVPSRGVNVTSCMNA